MAKIKNLVPATLVLFVALSAFSQSRTSHRASFGDLRATAMESLVAKLYPRAHFEWNPELRITANGAPEKVSFPGFTLRPISNGTFEGATGVELGNAKEQFLYKSKHFRSDNSSKFSTNLVIFETDAHGSVTNSKTFPLDSSDVVTEVKVIDIKAWNPGSWPLLRIQYDTYIVTPGSFSTIEWYGMIDAGTGTFVSRLPFGVVKNSKDGSEEIHLLTVKRQDSATLRITDQSAKISFEYQCSDPCVIDAGRLQAALSVQE